MDTNWNQAVEVLSEPFKHLKSSQECRSLDSTVSDRFLRGTPLGIVAVALFTAVS